MVGCPGTGEGLIIQLHQHYRQRPGLCHCQRHGREGGQLYGPQSKGRGQVHSAPPGQCGWGAWPPSAQGVCRQGSQGRHVQPPAAQQWQHGRMRLHLGCGVLTYHVCTHCASAGAVLPGEPATGTVCSACTQTAAGLAAQHASAPWHAV